MASTTNSPRVEETPEPDETRTRLFRPGVHARGTAVDTPVRQPVVVTDDPVVETTDPDVVEERRVVTKRAHTSPAATLSLIAGVVAAYTAVLVFLSPADIVLGVVAVVFGLFGLRAGSKVGVTGRWLAALGTLLGLGAILLGSLTVADVHTSLNDRGAVDRMQQQVDQWRDRVNDANLSDGITG